MTEILLGSALFTGLVLLLALIVLGARALLWPRGGARITVNHERVIEGDLGEKLLDTLDQGGVFLPRSCAVGICGLCKVRVSGPGVEGERGDRISPVERTALKTSEVAAGFRLACQTVLRGDLAVTVPPELLAVESWVCSVIESRNLSPLIKEITLALPNEEHHAFPAGSYALLSAPPFRLSFADMPISPAYEAAWLRLGLRKLNVKSRLPQTRAYSLVNRPFELDRLVFNIRLALPPGANPDAPPGLVSSYLFGLKPGDSLKASGPYGDFFVRDGDGDRGREMLFIGGGVGMAPLYAHVYDQLTRLNTKRTISYWYGTRSVADLYYADEMETLAREYENFSWHVALSDPAPEEEWAGQRGFIHEVVHDTYLSTHPNPKAIDYYLCGPPLMIKAVNAMLDKLGVPREQVYFDDFGG